MRKIDPVGVLLVVGFLAVMVICLLTPGARGSDAVGTVSPTGYVLRSDGYWWHSGVPYQRFLVDGFYSLDHRGCRIWNNTYYRYDVVKIVHHTKLIDSPTFEQDVLKVVQQREEKAYRLKVLQSLGLTAGGYSQSYLQSITTHGKTLYGYNQSVNELSRVDHSIDVNALLLQMDQSVKAAMSLSGQAVTGQQQIVAQVATDRAAQDERSARYAAALKLIDGPAVLSTETKRYDFAAKPPPAPEGGFVPLKKDQPSLQRLSQFFATSCAACHSGQKTEGNLDLEKWPTFTDEQKARVMVRINLPTTDRKFMPRDLKDPSKPGQPARREDKQAVAEN